MVKIYKIKDVFTGEIISSDNTDAQIGTLILKDIVKNDLGYHGKLYAVKRKKWYDARIIVDSDILELTVAIGFFSKTIEWNKEKIID